MPKARSKAAKRRGVSRRLAAKPTFVLPAIAIALLVVVSLFPGFFAGLFGHGDPYYADLAYSQDGPSPGHPFGFDLQGRDIWANVIYGTRTSIAVGLTATVLSVAIAVVLGTAAGYRAGWVDSLITRLTEVFLGFPFLLAAIVVLNSVSQRNVWTVSLVLGIFGWPAMARLVRASVRQVCQLDYVMAARVLGLPAWRIVTRHVLPNAITPVLILATITIGAVIVAESSLTYLGVGLQQPTISWGLQIAAGSRNFQTAPHMLVFASAFLTVTVLAIICLGEALRSTLDPKRLA
ncbi:MAG: ABC transporter permease [Bifidobacteriaceae bacterium]|jgi:ABC-type dipeptide/oligopeptide/nickel transport system permease subunit|nr:ABC transporter permease [Bifidobacteriaceae bacterium]